MWKPVFFVSLDCGDKIHAILLLKNANEIRNIKLIFKEKYLTLVMNLNIFIIITTLPSHYIKNKVQFDEQILMCRRKLTVK